MLYTQFRENERTARFEVKLIPGNRCQLVASGGSSSGNSDGETKTRTRKSAAKQEWTIGDRDDASWVDLESELKRLSDRAPIDLNFRPSDDGGAGAEMLSRLNGLLDGLYRGDSAENYMTYLGLLNIFEYFRIIRQLKRTGNEVMSARQIGIVSDEYFECRKIALELDIAELTEWLVAHDIGLPDLSIFYPEDYQSEGSAPPAKKRGKKKEGEDGVQEASGPIPESLHHVVELIRLHQADANDLLHFVDDVMHRGNFENLQDAIGAIQQVVTWIDPQQFEASYHSMKDEQARETARQQAAILRQHDLFSQRPRRGKVKGSRHDRHERREHLDRRAPGESFAGAQPTEAGDGRPAFERSMEAALADDAHALESGAEEIHANGHAPVGEDAEASSVEMEGVEPEFDFDDASPAYNRPQGGPPNDRQGRRGRRRPGGRPGGPGPRPQHGGRGQNGQRQQRGPHSGPAPQRGPRQGGSRQPNFDEIQPISNYSPGLPPVGVPGAAKPGGRPNNNKWRKRR